ncbi:zinc ribbon domain-containing protein [Levilactobacillus tujiorum]|uniref:Zinc-ribbon domain-containing protein n=1 Tax=Levilactobacillus tujiorum TaxID=2912243 RepID=A0ABX1LC50_9LACO|nr:zinc ribbon domain-containing protein [Levilactobacillus tujiorum]MCH5465644.1 zinc-ribbon domain-containing protein [Levilactobacillus tujiorum]NLR12750.1 zinc-ribbon domain-containing protein [Lactobacillus sp. HBUAS51387]NLR30665.1 zinc-ribbon domain-containing protein [Levilactobacillus tujiorum]
MKYCTKCGHPLKDDQPFCTNCGAKQTISADSANATASKPASEPAQGATVANLSHNQTLWLIVGVIVVITLGIGGYYGSNTYKRNHLTEQEIADIGAGVATKYLGSDAVKVYYNKSDNELTMVAKSGTALYDRAEDSISDYGDIDSLSPYVGKFKKISTAMSPQMPTDLRDVRVEFMNPENTDRYLYVTENGKVAYDFTTDDD